MALLPNRPVRDIFHDGARVLVCGGQLFGSQTFGLYTTSNDGVSWTPLHDGTWPSQVLTDIALDPNDVNTIYVATSGKGLFRSTNAGLNWAFQVGGTGSLSINAVSFSPGSSSVLYTGASSSAVWKSVDSGASFSPSSNGISSLDVFSIASNPLNGDELAIAFQGLNDGGAYTSLDGGASWSLEALPGTRFNIVYFTPAGQLFAISDGPTTIAPEALYRRTGTTWTSIGPDQGTLFESELYTMRVSASNPNLIFAGGQDFGVAGFEQTLWRTLDGGVNWTKTFEGVASQPVQDLHIVDALTDTTLVACFTDFTGGNTGGVLRSTTGGAVWVPSNAGLSVPRQPYSLAVSPTDPNTLFLSNDASTSAAGIYRSTDTGQNWTPTGFVGAVRQVQTDVGDPNVLYIAQGDAVRVQASTDGGATFAPYNTGLASAGFPRDLQRPAGAGSDLLMATTTGGYATEIVARITSVCPGDGTGTACPCGNNGAPGLGCANSTNTAGALLTASGTPNPDTLVLASSGMPATVGSIYLQGDASNGLGVVFGDGVRCADGFLIRLRTKINSGGASQFPETGDPSVSTRGMVTPGSGAVRYYQTYYRNASAAFCPPATFNITNGLRVIW